MVLAILGMGKIGSGVYEAAQAQDGMRVKKILDRNCWMDNMTSDIAEIMEDAQIDTVVETMGGLHPSYEYAVQALESGKHFVTANKFLVSRYGVELAALARQKGVSFLFGAACGGGIPYLAAVAEARQREPITAVGGIMNGTTNYILDRMQRNGLSYARALADAQALGYAEQDPSADVDGLDALSKCRLACLTAFGADVCADSIACAGIRHIAMADLDDFCARGWQCRLTVHARRAAGRIAAYVEPTLVSAGAVESAISLNRNYLWYESARSGRIGMTGQGAGKLPTGANVVADVRRIGRGEIPMMPAEIVPMRADNGQVEHAYYAVLPAGETDARLRAAATSEKAGADGTQIIITRPLAVAEMHEMMRGHAKAFFAGIGEEAENE